MIGKDEQKLQKIKTQRELIKALVAVLLQSRQYVAKMKADGVETVFSPSAMLGRIDKVLDEADQALCGATQ